ncbi:MAG: hypothetical protein ACRCSI_02405 [Eubacterium aggregans]
MAGQFIVAYYQRNDDTVGPIKVQPETVTSWNPQQTGTVTGYYIKARGSKKAYGTVARSVTLTRKVGSGAAYNAGTVSVTVPIFTKTAWSALATGQTLAYNGVTDWVVAGTNAEESK